MFFILSKTLLFLLKPFNLILVTMLAGMLFSKRHAGRKMVLASLLMIVLFGNGFLFNTVLLLWEIPASPLTAIPDNCRYAIVLGGTADVEREPRDRLYFNKGAERITQAVNLHRAGKALQILYTGGRSELFGNPEADNQPIFDFYTMCGVPVGDIILESRSRNTRENALLSKEMLREIDNPGPVILLTSAFHMRRSLACFRKVGLDVVPFSTDFNSVLPADRYKIGQFFPSSKTLYDWEFLIKEMVGFLVYRLSGYA